MPIGQLKETAFFVGMLRHRKQANIKTPSSKTVKYHWQADTYM